MIREKPVYVLNSFALLAWFRDEVAADTVEYLLRQGSQSQAHLFLSVANLGEVYYKTIREYGLERGQEVLTKIGEYSIELVDVDRSLALAAAYIKGFHRLSYADCLAAALAQRLNGAVVTGDPEFKQIESLVTVEWLPT